MVSKDIAGNPLYESISTANKKEEPRYDTIVNKKSAPPPGIAILNRLYSSVEEGTTVPKRHDIIPLDYNLNDFVEQNNEPQVQTTLI